MRIGITGGIATGKSRVTQLLRDRGCITFSADEAARAVLSVGSDTLERVVSVFGSESLCGNGELNRTWLGKRVFGDAVARRELELITHPPIVRLLIAQMTAVETDFPLEPVFVEVPLLYEAKLEPLFELIVVVAASEEVQRHRMMNRDGITSDEAIRRIHSQWSLDSKVSLADYVVFNDTTETELKQIVDFLISWMREKESRYKRRISIRQVY